MKPSTRPLDAEDRAALAQESIREDLEGASVVDFKSALKALGFCSAANWLDAIIDDAAAETARRQAASAVTVGQEWLAERLADLKDAA